MRTRNKVLLGLLGVVLAAALWAWLAGPAWLERFNQRQHEARATFTAQGEAFGRQSDQQGCLEHTLTDFNRCDGFDCTLHHGYFLKACLKEAAPSAGFCDGVPAYRETPTEDDKTWAKNSCWDRGIRGEGCRLLLKQQQLWCSGGR